MNDTTSPGQPAVDERAKKPLGIKAYGSIPHLPTSRMGPADHHCHEGQARIATEKARDRHDVVTVQEKLDGSCVSVALIDGQPVALGRAGYLASTSPYEQHHMFAEWVTLNASRFDGLLTEGERVVGEWLAQAHGTRYALPHDPFVPFDLMRGGVRATVEEVVQRAAKFDFATPRVIAEGPTSVAAVVALLDPSGHGALDPVEGAVWRVERKERVDFLVKWVRPDKVDGSYLPEITGREAVWNWRPQSLGVSGS